MNDLTLCALWLYLFKQHIHLFITLLHKFFRDAGKNRLTMCRQPAFYKKKN